eukprot:1067479-Pyramimonas_sp.AAC.1
MNQLSFLTWRSLPESRCGRGSLSHATSASVKITLSQPRKRRDADAVSSVSMRATERATAGSQ